MAMQMEAIVVVVVVVKVHPRMYDEYRVNVKSYHIQISDFF